MFEKPAGGWAGALTEVTKLTASDAAAIDTFGILVSISGDTVVLGASLDDCPAFANCGSAYVFDGVAVTDTDGDGVPDTSDLCPGTSIANPVDANGCSDVQVDADFDGVCDPDAVSSGPSICTGSDNCPADVNANQDDNDGDALGDVCDDDDDNDGILDTADNCPLIDNPTQDDNDLDGQGDVCDPDDDNDGIPDVLDQCADSDQAPTVVIGGCDSGVPNTLLGTGCGLSDLIADLAAGATNQGSFTSTVAHLLNDLKKAGIITGQQKGAIQSCAGGAAIP